MLLSPRPYGQRERKALKPIFVHVCDRPFRPGVITGQSPDFADPVRRAAIGRWLTAHNAGPGVHRVVAINGANVYVRKRSWPGLVLDVCGEQVTANGA